MPHLIDANLSRIIDRIKFTIRNTKGSGPKGNWKLGAAIMDPRHREFLIETNIKKTHPLLAKYSNFPFLHAESRAIITKGLKNAFGDDLVVIRMLRDNRTLSMAKPCEACMALMKDVGIKRVFYSSWTGEIECQVVSHS